MAEKDSGGDNMDVDEDDNALPEVLKAMMVSFGDVKEPLKESVDVVYEVLRSQMDFMLVEAEGMAKVRKRKQITHEETLFLMRKNKGKIKRLIRYLEVMDDMPGFGKKAALSFSCPLGNDDQTHERKRAEQCIDFFATIEDCGDFTSIFSDDTVIDIGYKRMLERRNPIVKWMNLKEYTEYTEKLLEKSFWTKPTLKDFGKWLVDVGIINMNLTTLALEIFQFLVRETVSKIVDLALIIKSQQNRKAKSPEVFLKPFNFYEIMKECNFPEFSTPHSIKDSTARNIDHSYHANNDSQESSIVPIHRSTSIPGTSKSFVESKAPTKKTVSLVTGGEKIDEVDKLHNSSNVPVISEDLVTPKVLTSTAGPSVIRVKNVGAVDYSHYPTTTVPETPEDIAGPSKPDLESISGIANQDNSDSITQQCTVLADDTNEDQPMDESDSQNQYIFDENNSDSQSKQGDRNFDESTQLSNTDRMTPPDVTPSYSRCSSSDTSEDRMRKDQEPSENEHHPQTPITAEEIMEAVAVYQQRSWSNCFHSSDKPPKIKLLCIDDHCSLLMM